MEKGFAYIYLQFDHSCTPEEVGIPVQYIL